jgi:methyl-accepting chemotaxis protein
MKRIITKLFLLFLIWVTGYSVTVFIAPELATNIDNIIGFPGLSDNIKESKLLLDTAITDIPDIQEIRSWAVDLGAKISDGIDTTKETIDTIRSGAQKAGESYNSAKDTIDGVKQTLSGATQTVSEIQNLVESMNNLTNP